MTASAEATISSSGTGSTSASSTTNASAGRYFPPHGFNPNVFSIGVAYHFRGTRRSNHPEV